MKSYIKALTIIFVLTLLLAASTTSQTVPTPAQTTSGAAIQQQMIKEANKTADDVMQKLVQLNIATAGQYGGEKVLVIPTSQIQPQDMVNLMEDMTVMCNILDKKLEQSNLISGMSFIGVTLPGRPGRFSLGGDSIGAMYVQGYGALFMTTVDFPLSPPPETEEKEDTKEEDADPVWEQMRQEIFSPEKAVRPTSGRQEEKYDAEKVKNLKTTLIEALVHAANIRGLQPDESVILTVTGSGGDGSSDVGKVVAISGTDQVVMHYKDRNATKVLKSPSLNDLGVTLLTVLTIRAKKSYIDELAQKKIDYDEFEEKIQLISYPSLGQNIGGKSSTFFWPSETSRSNVYVPSSPYDGGVRSDRRRGRSSGVDTMESSSGDRRARR